MQDKYTGDVGDFGKFGLLRVLCGQNDASTLSLGVVWYLAAIESPNNDGKHIKYLLDPPPQEFSDCDPSFTMSSEVYLSVTMR